jgi:hypothetical protein
MNFHGARNKVLYLPIQEKELPKENTHILFVSDIISSIKCNKIKAALQAHYKALCFGCIVPDTFFYSSHKDVNEISDRLHGKDGEKTNELTFELLDRAKQFRSESLLCMASGYISHCVFDMFFHPVIYSLAGNFYDNNVLKREAAVYNHRLMETSLDMAVNKKYYLHDILAANDRLIHEFLDLIAAKFNIANGDLIGAYKKQIIINRCFRNPFIYHLIYLLNKLKIKDFANILPLFYDHPQKDNMQLKGVVDYCDILHGHALQESFSNLFESAKEESIMRITAAFDYYDDDIDKSHAMQIIKGESLDTGREGCSVSKIAFSNKLIN